MLKNNIKKMPTPKLLQTSLRSIFNYLFQYG